MSQSSDPVTGSRNPDQIREEIEVTRVSLSTDVNALADSVRPGNVARRQVGKVRAAATGLKDRVMGVASDAGSAGSSALGSASGAVADTVGQAASSVRDAAAAAPDQALTRTQGNPLAAGLIAFGVGWLASSLLPATPVEQKAAEKVKDSAAPVTDSMKEAVSDAAGNLKEPVRDAAESVKQSATDAAGTMAAESRVNAEDVSAQAQDAARDVQDTRS